MLKKRSRYKKTLHKSKFPDVSRTPRIKERRWRDKENKDDEIHATKYWKQRDGIRY